MIGRVTVIKHEQRNVAVNGIAMNVVLAGEGEPLLLLHGFPDSSNLWRYAIPGLVRAGFRVIAPDQRGFGDSSAPSGIDSYRIECIAADAIALLDTLGIARAALIAHDWGAVIGWQLVGAYPDRFSAYVALAVGHPNALASCGIRQKLKSWYVAFFQWRGVAEKIFRARGFLLLNLITRETGEIPLWRRDLSRPGRLTAAMNWYRANFNTLTRGDFPRTRVATLGLIGSDDVALTVEQMEQSAQFVDAPFECHVIADKGHWLPLHACDEIEPRIVAFLRAHP
jgi:pimeloyl-ACP methyl ester carboxylesterase